MWSAEETSVYSLLKDLSFAVRTLRKNPTFAITALMTLALGIGASAAIFSVVDAVLLRPLPYANADRLVFLTSDLRKRNVKDFPVAPADLKDLREQGTLFSGIAGLNTNRVPFIGDNGEPEQINLAAATTNLFPILGVHIVAGRDFVEEDGAPQAPLPLPQQGAAPAGARAGGAPTPGVAPTGAPPAGGGQAIPAAPPPPRLPAIAILSYGFWKRKFGGDTNIIGKSVNLGRRSAQVVGVAGPAFELLFPPRLNVTRSPDIVTAMRVDFETASRINVTLRLIGRLNPGVTILAAQGQVNTITADLRKRFPIKETAGLVYRVEPMHAVLVADVKTAVLSLMGGVTFVLLIACANVANLLLVRTSRRERELAVRAALGGSRARLIRQMLAEALVLSTGGALLGLVLARLGIKLLIAIGPQNLPRMDNIAMDPMVLGFTIAATLVAAVVFGIVPALRASRTDVITVLRSSGRSAELGAGKALRNGVVMAEVALAFVLLVGSGLMFRSFLAVTRANPGFDPQGLLTFAVQGGRANTPEETAAFEQVLRQRLSGLPGVTAVTAAGPMPLDGLVQNSRWGTEAAVNDPSAFQQANLFTVLPGFFETLRVRLIDGRTFTEADNIREGSNVIVDQHLAAKAFPGQSAVGKRLYTRFRSNEPEWVNIIGVVAPVRHASISADGPEEMFFTDGMFGFGVAGRWAVRTSGDPIRLAPAVRGAIGEIDRSILVAEMKPMSDYVDQARAPTRFALVLVGVFAGIAVVLCGVGLYGVLATVVRQRTAEIGVRMALGAPSRDIFRLVIGQGLRLSAIGIVVGLAAAFALTRAMRSMLVGVEPTDPATFVAISVLFVAIATAACWIPARRASRVDPTVALREE
jgi:putative ABC transport system permease protein